MKEIKPDYSFIKNYRLNKLKEDNVYKLNWLFLPGGPGMGANYLIDFVSKLDLQGSLFIADFPGDGDNHSTEEIHYEGWKAGLIEVVNSLSPCILVTHSFSGMFALTIDSLEGHASILQLRLLKSYTFNKSTNNLIMNIQ